MHHLIHVAEVWLWTNAVALVAGGYLGYRYGAKAEALVVKVLGLLKKI